MSFARPATSTGIKWEDLKGKLLIVEPLELVANIKTAYGDSSAVRANVTVVDGDGTYNDTLIFPKLLQNAVKGAIGSLVLGRLGQGVAKPGQSAPWIILDPTPADITAGEAHLRAHPPATAPF